MTAMCIAKLARIKEALMARLTSKFSDYGIDDDPEMIVDRFVSLLASMYPAFTLDNLLVRPREALRFCDEVRRRENAYDLPDDVILQPLMNRRKHG